MAREREHYQRPRVVLHEEFRSRRPGPSTGTARAARVRTARSVVVRHQGLAPRTR